MQVFHAAAKLASNFIVLQRCNVSTRPYPYSLDVERQEHQQLNPKP